MLTVNAADIKFNSNCLPFKYQNCLHLPGISFHIFQNRLYTIYEKLCAAQFFLPLEMSGCYLSSRDFKNTVPHHKIFSFNRLCFLKMVRHDHTKFVYWSCIPSMSFWIHYSFSWWVRPQTTRSACFLISHGITMMNFVSSLIIQNRLHYHKAMENNSSSAYKWHFFFFLSVTISYKPHNYPTTWNLAR